MSRSGESPRHLTPDEKRVVFEEVRLRGSDHGQALQVLGDRDPTTVRRACKVVLEFETDDLVRLDDQLAAQIRERVGYSTTSKYVTDLFADWRVWKSQRETRRLNLDDLMQRVWLPDADDTPLNLFVHDSGFHSETVQDHDFSWEQQGSTVVRCWFTEVEEKWLIEAIEGLLADAQGHRHRYHELQERASTYVTRAARYRYQIDTETGRVPLKRLDALRVGGMTLSPDNPEMADSLYLMKEGPRLRGLADQFVRDLRTELKN